MNIKYFALTLLAGLSFADSFGRKKCTSCSISTIKKTTKQPRQIKSTIHQNPAAIEHLTYSRQPSNSSKTPTTLDFIYHAGGFPLTIFGWKSKFYSKRIFFGTKITKINNVIHKEAIYQTIKEHAAINPEFGNVLLVIYYPDKSKSERFKILGTYSNRKARKEFLRIMTKLSSEEGDGAFWCPEQNAIIARTMYSEIDDSLGIIKVVNYEIGKEFEQFRKDQTSKQKFN